MKVRDLIVFLRLQDPEKDVAICDEEGDELGDAIGVEDSAHAVQIKVQDEWTRFR